MQIQTKMPLKKLYFPRIVKMLRIKRRITKAVKRIFSPFNIAIFYFIFFT